MEGFIRDNLPLEPVPFVPEISLHKAVPTSGLHRLAAADESFGNPYWAHYWGGGLALARYLLDNPEWAAGRVVLDLGTGSGIVAIAAARAGAVHVVAADVDPYAVTAARLNAAANGVDMETALGDLTRSRPLSVELLAIGDLFYDRVTAARVLRLAEQHAANGATVLIGDPLRAHLPITRLCELARYHLSETAGVEMPTGKPAAVYQLMA